MRKLMKPHEAELTKGTLPQTRAALLKRIKEIRQAKTKAKAKAKAQTKARSKPGGRRS